MRAISFGGLGIPVEVIDQDSCLMTSPRAEMSLGGTAG